MLKKIAAAVLVVHVIAYSGFAQVKTNVSTLMASAQEQKIKDQQNYQRAMELARQKGWETLMIMNGGNIARLVGVDQNDRPVYYVTESNVIAAATTGANHLWAGGSSGLNLSGSSNSVKGKMAIWDGGRVLGTHVELNGRIMYKDAASSFSDHSTHVAGTMIASGVNSTARGMAYGFQELHSYDYTEHLTEILSGASNLLISNHSYGTLTGWNFNQSLNRWEWYGPSSGMEDPNFGYYNTEAMMFDSVAYNAPYYLIVKSSGNNRASNGPAVGQTYYYNSGGGWVSATRPPGMNSNDGFDIISTYGTAKNILTIGAVNGIANGYTNVNDVVMSTFSSWGPTDDGRIKPDLVADGVNVTSPIASSNSAYGIMSGTSMATPNASGSLLLLQEYYAQLHAGNFMRSATLKAVAIHTADEAGSNPGPDYKFGWGLLNVNKASSVIKSNNLQSHQIFENVLMNGQTYTYNVVASGPLVATLVWTDVKGTVNTTNILNNTTPKLVNDLDIRIIQNTNTYMPWILDPANPNAAATTGDNNRDNVEKIQVAGAVPGLTYTIQITHKGTLERGQQAYSLILSGVNGQVFCTSSPTSSTGARIDSVSFGSIQHLNQGNCTTYSDYTSISTNVEPNQVLSLTVRVNSCDGSTADKIIKAFIDLNNNGTFTDPGENIATSGVINGNGIFTTQVTIGQNVIIGNPSVMRIVVQETSNPADVSSCGSYSAGETQDYRIIFANPSNDLKVDGLADWTSPACANASQFVTVRVKNSGTASQSNIPMALEIKNGASVVHTQTGMLKGTLAAGETKNYSFPTAFNSLPGVTYTIAVAVDHNDQNNSNDTLFTTINVGNPGTAPSGQGRICGTTGMLLANNASPNYVWYADPNGNPIGVGFSLSTPVIPANNTYYIGTGARIQTGLASKSDFPNGGDYLSGINSFMKYTSSLPLTLETVKLYSKKGGKVEFIVGDITSETGTSFNYTVLSSKTIDVYTSSPVEQGGNVAGYDAQDTGGIYLLNLQLPSSTGNRAIIIKTQGDVNLFRNNNLTGNPYPIGIPNVFAFTGNSAATESGNMQNHYYFLYDARLRTADCPSNKGTVVATPATTPTITRNGNTLTSSSPSGNQWYFNGNAISGAFAQNYNATQSGNYSVQVTDIFGCQRMSAETNVTFTAVEPVPVNPMEWTVTPNPGKGILNLKFKTERKDDLQIEIVNAVGQVVFRKSYGNFSGSLTEVIDLRTQAAGIYIFRLAHNNQVMSKKIVLE